MLDTVFDLAISKKLLFVTGKGGIGKSIIAASIASVAANSGKSVLLVQQAAVDHIGPLFGRSNIGHEGLEVSPRLQVVNFTSNGNFKDFIVKHLKHGALFESIAGNKVVHSFFRTIPGFGELMFLGRLYYTLNLAPIKPDLVIVDSPASGHFLSLMTTPTAVIESGIAGPIVAETQNVLKFLSDESQCGTLLIGIPEELVVSEMIEFLQLLKLKSPVSTCGVLFNRCLKEMGSLEVSSEINRYLRSQIDRQKAAWQIWSSRSNNILNDNCRVYNSPELGFIDDPISLDISRSLVCGGRIL